MTKYTAEQFSGYIAHSVIEHCRDFISIRDLNNNYLACNKAMLKFFNIKNNEGIINKNLYDLFPEQKAQILDRNSKEILKFKQTKNFLIDINDNMVLNLTMTPIIENNTVKAILTIGRDITNEEHLKIKLLEKIYQLNSLLEYIPMLVYMKDTKLNYITGSAHARNFVINGIDFYADNVKLDKSGLKDTTLDEDNYVLNTKNILNKEKQVFDTEGNTHWYKICKAPIPDWNNNVSGIVTIAKNIDKEKQLETQRELFIATLTHDLKNPLIAQINSLKMLSDGFFGKLTSKQQEITGIILESAEFMEKMMQNILSTYKFENGCAKLSKIDFNAEELVHTCIQEIISAAEEKNISIKYTSRLQSSRKTIFADNKQIRRVISNILNNMVNYAFKNTILEIKTGIKNDRLVFSFSNTSPQIPENIKKHIFEKYISGAFDFKKTGCGLGLYFSKKVIEAHNGSIYLRSDNTKNTFIFELPIVSGKENQKNIIRLT